jgi:hypothetical protein
MVRRFERLEEACLRSIEGFNRRAPFKFYAKADSASRTSIFATLPPSLTPAAATAAWNFLFFASSSALSL